MRPDTGDPAQILAKTPQLSKSPVSPRVKSPTKFNDEICGLAVGSILAFQTVLMAWYGVNFLLGSGMHSYGFGKGGLRYVLGFGLAEGLFAAAAFAFPRRAKKSDAED